MGALLGLGVGTGLLLIWSAFMMPRAVGREPTSIGHLEDLLARAGMGQVGPNALIGGCAVSGVVVFLAALTVTGVGTVSLAFGLIAGYLPVAMVAGRGRRRQREFAQVWPEAVDNLSSGVRAGLSLPEAVASLADRGPVALRPAFAGFALDYQVSGRFSESLDRLKSHLADPVGDRVVEGLRVAREVGGGDLGTLLRNLSGYLRDDARTRSELESRQAWSINAARLAVAGPWLVLAFMSFQPEVITRYSSPGGALVLGIGAALCLVAYRLMVRIGRLPEPQRILR
ncbi:MAG: type II secretion system F family protein [Nocardioides sp.]